MDAQNHKHLSQRPLQAGVAVDCILCGQALVKEGFLLPPAFDPQPTPIQLFAVRAGRYHPAPRRLGPAFETELQGTNVLSDTVILALIYSNRR